MQEIVLSFGQTGLTAFHVLLILVFGIGGLLLWLVLSLSRQNARRAYDLAQSQAYSRAQHAQVEELARLQAEMTGRMQTMSEIFSTRQSEMAQALTNRMDGMGHRLGQSLNQTMAHQQKATGEHLKALHERLAVIDKAQGNLAELSGRMVELQHILANKHSRGAFGQGRMEAIIQDGLPSNAYDFQYTLSNGKRPDCVVHLPNDGAVLVVDAKFPLEGWNLVRDAQTPQESKAAQAQFRQDIKVHIRAISERYFIPGETQETAFMFVPSESLFADLHEHFDDLVQLSHRARVVIVSPSLLMLSIQVVQSILKDARMREQAHVIQREVVMLMEDVSRLDERVFKLQTHFNQTSKDIDQILTSTSKIVKRGRKIEDIDVQESDGMLDGSGAGTGSGSGSATSPLSPAGPHGIAGPKQGSLI